MNSPPLSLWILCSFSTSRNWFTLRLRHTRNVSSAVASAIPSTQNQDEKTSIAVLRYTAPPFAGGFIGPTVSAQTHSPNSFASTRTLRRFLQTTFDLASTHSLQSGSAGSCVKLCFSCAFFFCSSRCFA